MDQRYELMGNLPAVLRTLKDRVAPWFGRQVRPPELEKLAIGREDVNIRPLTVRQHTRIE